MAPIKPLAPLPIPPATPGHKPPPVQGEGDEPFRPGLKAPRAAPRAASPVTQSAVRPASAPQQNFTLQALSAYAGMVIGADNAVTGEQPGKRSVAQGDDGKSAPGAAGESRPLPPGTMLDLKV